MKYIKYLLLSIPFFLLSITNASATTIDYSKFNFTPNAYFTNCKSNDNCKNFDVVTENTISTSGEKVINIWGTKSTLNSVANSSGVALTFYANEGFVKGNVYTVSVLIDSLRSATTLTTNTKKVNVGSSLDSAFVGGTGVIESSQLSIDTINLYGTTINYPLYLLNYTFKAPSTGNYVFLTMTTTTTITGYWQLYGYNVIDHGSQSVSSDDIKNALDSNFNSINNNINNVENSINNNINSVNNNINDMKESIDNSINSDDSDVNSSKCGIVCKLKNIAVGIIDLPVKIWEKLKDGFDLIKNAIGDFCNTIIGIFLPEPECTISPNLFDFDDFVSRNTTKTTNKVTGTAEDFYIQSGNSGEYDLTYIFNDDVGDYRISFDYETDSKYFYFRIFQNALPGQLGPSGDIINTSSSPKSGHIDIYLGERGLKVTNAIFTPWMSKARIKNLMITKGSKSYDYSVFGAESCTEASFFSWFERFGQIIKGFFDTLLGGILDGLKSLFVPSDEQLLDIIDKSQELSENFGFVGQSVNFFLNIFTSLLGLVNANGCVQLPEMTIGATSLTESHTFWESQLVCLNDNAILSNNIDTIRTITSIALVCLFVNFASRKFFEVLSKNEAPEQTQNIGGMYR